MQYGAARVAEHMLDALLLETTYDYFGTHQLHGLKILIN